MSADVKQSETVKGLCEARDRCAAELKRLKQSLKGMEAKVGQTEAKLEMAEEMLAIAKRAEALEQI